jgi:Raf kinase inhibitor-like YbhB/YbcL family protein
VKLFSNNLVDGNPIDPHFAFGCMDADTHMSFSDNNNPHFSWQDLPQGAESLVLLCVDPDVPSVGDAVNVEGKSIPAGLPRVDFYHWVLVDIPTAINEIAPGSCADTVISGGKQSPAGPAGSRQGLNDYTSFMAGSDMAGNYFGYDGPCPPWNDEHLHHYVFTLYALDVQTLDLPTVFDGRDVQAAIAGHVLGSASISGTYTLNPAVS